MTVSLLIGDCRKVLPTLPEKHFHACVTSPPYFGLRDYGDPRQLGLEKTPKRYVRALVQVFRQVHRVLRDDGVLWLNLGDSYARESGGREPGGKHFGKQNGVVEAGAYPRRPYVPRGSIEAKPKDLIGIPWAVAFALRAEGWYLRGEQIWEKPNPTPESVRDRPTRAHEHVFLLSKAPRYFYDSDAIREPHVDPRMNKNGRTKMHGQAALRPRGNLESVERWYNPAGRNKRSVWEIATEPYPEAHFAVMPRELVKPCILAGTSERGCCARCGAPVERKVAARRLVDGEARPLRAARNTDRAAPDRAQGVGHGRITIARETTGWAPRCACDAGTVPCRVLDPFGGTATVGGVAQDLGRDATIIELNPAYQPLAERRLAQQGLLARAWQSEGSST